MAANNFLDTDEALYVLLYNLSTVRAAVTDSQGVHIYGPPGLPNTLLVSGAQVAYTPRKAIMYVGDGGPAMDDAVPLDKSLFQFRSYGNTPQEAKTLSLLLRKYLDRKKLIEVTVANGVGLLQYAHMTTQPIAREEPETGWYFSWSQWKLDFLTVTIR